MEAKLLLEWRRWGQWRRWRRWRCEIVDNGGDGSEIVNIGGEIIVDGDYGGNYLMEVKLLLE